MEQHFKKDQCNSRTDRSPAIPRCWAAAGLGAKPGLCTLHPQQRYWWCTSVTERCGVVNWELWKTNIKPHPWAKPLAVNRKWKFGVTLFFNRTQVFLVTLISLRDIWICLFFPAIQGTQISPGSRAGTLILALFQRESLSSSFWRSGAWVETLTLLESSVLLGQGFHAASSFSARTYQLECHCQKESAWPLHVNTNSTQYF